jgi:3-methylcrotonyl-CoA carboxylase alpha subunit
VNSAPQAEEEIAGGRLTAPMPGKIIQVLAAAEATVRRGQGLIVLEAMKMEHTVSAPADGVVERVNYAVGDLVEEGAELIVFVLPEGAKGS